MMKKVLFVAAVAMSLVFSGCMKEDDTYKKLKPVQPGLNIYTGAMNQNIVSMQQANFGLRLAMLVAEADKQQKTIDCWAMPKSRLRRTVTKLRSMPIMPTSTLMSARARC